MSLTSADRLKLDEMIRNYGAEDMTNSIKTLKHSSKIRADAKHMQSMKLKYARLRKTNPDQFKEMAMKQCSFLFEKYTNIFIRLLKDELNMMLLDKLLDLLKNIEDGKMNQHEASVKVGTLLKEIYIDSALKGQHHQEALEEKMGRRAKKERDTTKKISWDSFKKNKLEEVKGKIETESA